MFNGFTKETSDFLWELSFHNERPWFLEHKAQFERCLNEPFKALGQETVKRMKERWPYADWQIHISRIYRDARRLYGRGPYKDHLWFSIKDGGDYSHGIGFWFEVNAVTYLYGTGMYDLSPRQMDAFRRYIDANPARFERLAAEIERQGRFTVTGEEYKKPKGDRGEIINRWYNRKWVSLERQADFGGDLLSPQLPELLIEDFERLMPIYEYFMEFYRAVRDLR